MTNAELKRESKKLFKIFQKLLVIDNSQINDLTASTEFVRSVLNVGQASVILKDIADQKLLKE